MGFNRYDELDSTALQILMDYSEGIFPLDLLKICEKLRIKLIPYSQLSNKQLQGINAIAKNGELKDGCSIILRIPDNEGYLAYTYYNDNLNDIDPYRVNYTIGHEIKHVVYDETDPSDIEEAEAEHFSRMLLAPCCVLMIGKYTTTMEIVEKFHLSYTASANALRAKTNRVNKHGDKLFNYEIDFIDWYLENIKKSKD